MSAIDVLTPSLIEAGRELVQRLDSSGLDIKTALWLREPSESWHPAVEPGGLWRLILATPQTSIQGPKRLYEIVDRELRHLTTHRFLLHLHDISVVDPSDPPVAKLKDFHVADKSSTAETRLHRAVVDGLYVDDAIVYRST
jgi:hypothetical protein